MVLAEEAAFREAGSLQLRIWQLTWKCTYTSTLNYSWWPKTWFVVRSC